VTGIVSLHFRRLDRVDQAFGIEALNQLLNDIGERLGNRLEANESLARSHEHTFAALIPVGTDEADDADRHLMARAHALVAAVTEAGFEVAGDTLQVQVYAGVARAPPDSRDAQELVLRAEEVTQRGANSDTELVRWADHTIKPAQRQQIKFESKLQRAVTERELVLHYQPIVDLASGEVVGAEALARWPQPDGQAPIGPDHFIPLAEELGLMGRLGAQVFEDACRQLHRWQAHPGNAAFWVSVNVAPAQLRDPDIADHFSAIAREVGVSPAHVKLEITESALEHGLDEVIHAIDALAAAGFPLALDDFGTGYSSLRRLIDMPFNIIKVDRSFVSQTPDGRGAGVVASLSQLSSHLHIHALGEGVENAVHEAFLRANNYRFAQGYYYAKPMAAADFATWSGWPTD
ncbi:putative bifunctional diguanylate cyclase/phosphodiesterase, partial [Thioalkalivibrio sp.]